MMTILSVRLWKSSNPVLTPPVVARMLFCTMIAGCWFLRLTWSWAGGKLKFPKAQGSYCDSAIFLEQTLLEFIYRVLKEFALSVSASVLIAFMEERVFRGPFSISPNDILLAASCVVSSYLYPKFLILSSVNSNWMLNLHIDLNFNNCIFNF